MLFLIFEYFNIVDQILFQIIEIHGVNQYKILRVTYYYY